MAGWCCCARLKFCLMMRCKGMIFLEKVETKGMSCGGWVGVCVVAVTSEAPLREGGLG